MSPTCRDMSATTQRVAPILARWVRVADTKFKMSWQFVSARADILPNFRNSYVETYYYGMGVHTHRYPTLISVIFSFLSCSPHETKITTTYFHNTETMGAVRHALSRRPLSSGAHSDTIDPFPTANPMSGTLAFK
jgi:hypothetical protein